MTTCSRSLAVGPDVAAGTKAEPGSPRALEEIPWGAGGAVMSPLQCPQGAVWGLGAGGSPVSARVHAPIVPDNNGGAEQAPQPMTQPRARGAAGWQLKGSSVRVPPSPASPQPRGETDLCPRAGQTLLSLFNPSPPRVRSFPAGLELGGPKFLQGAASSGCASLRGES